jgi:coenzyme F420 hydrogenase subunit beta
MRASNTLHDRHSIINVIASGLCVGCGACAVVDSRVVVARNDFGAMCADLSALPSETLREASSVCPFSDESADETTLGKMYFANAVEYDERIGRYLALFAGRVLAGEDLQSSSSGGLTSWLCVELMRAGLIDGVIHVGACSESVADGLFSYCLSSTIEDVRRRRKSQYYSTSFDGILSSIPRNGKRYAFVGVPCYIKAVRLLGESDPVLREQIAFHIGLVCGHMKSSAFSELLAWQVGIPPSRLARVDFRVKVPGRAVQDYEFAAYGVDGEDRHSPSNRLFGGSWGHAAFQLAACDYCDDIFGETADICFGDAWLPKFSMEWRGTNVVVVRSEQLRNLLVSKANAGAIALEPLTTEELTSSQSGNLRHRRDGLSVRLELGNSKDLWLPQKRIAPGSIRVNENRRQIVELRQQMARESHAAFCEAKARNSLDYYINHMRPMANRMEELSRQSLLSRVRGKAKALLHRLLRVNQT